MMKAFGDALAAARKGSQKAFQAARAQIQSLFAVTMAQVRAGGWGAPARLWLGAAGAAYRRAARPRLFASHI